MSSILIVIGSARKGRVAEKVAQYVENELKKHDDVSYVVADLKELNLPFFEEEVSPSMPDYKIADSRVQKWADLVDAADGIIFVSPEYNRSLSAIQKNAIDHLGTHWDNKAVTVVAYGWSGAQVMLQGFEYIAENLKFNYKKPVTQLYFMKDLNPDGTIIDTNNVEEKIAATVAAIV